MLKGLLTAATALAMLGGVAFANSGLTPGAPLGEDPLSGGKIVVGQEKGR